MHVHRALRPAGGAGGVDHHHRRLRVERRRGQLGLTGGRRGHPTGGRGRRSSTGPVPSRSQTITLRTLGRLRQRLVHQRLHRHGPALARHGVGGDQRTPPPRRPAAPPPPARRSRRRSAPRSRRSCRSRRTPRPPRPTWAGTGRRRPPAPTPSSSSASGDAVGELAPARRRWPCAPRRPRARTPPRAGRGRLAGVAVDAVVGEVDRAAAEPGRPLGAAGGVEYALVGPEELDPEVADDRVPEPLDVVAGGPVQRAPVAESLVPHEGGHARVLDRGGVGLPDVLGHLPMYRLCSRVPVPWRRSACYPSARRRRRCTSAWTRCDAGSARAASPPRATDAGRRMVPASEVAAAGRPRRHPGRPVVLGPQPVRGRRHVGRGDRRRRPGRDPGRAAPRRLDRDPRRGRGARAGAGGARRWPRSRRRP